MNNSQKQASLEQLNATNKAYELRRDTDDRTLAKLLELSRVTLYARFKESNWQDKEILFIEYHTNLDFKKQVDRLKILKK